MKTTLEIDEGVMRSLKEKAARDGKTMSELVESALRTLLAEKPPAKELPPLPKWDLGPLINVDSRAEWYDQIEEGEEDPEDVRR